MTQTLLVNKSDFADVTIVNHKNGPLAEDAIRVSVGPWALTANNITYMVAGDQIGYWGFFRPDAYGIDMEGHGRMPVWGYGKVTESRCEGIEAGQEFYGFLPITKSFDMTPAEVSPSGFIDGAAHRQELHGLYNRYSFIDSDPSFGMHKDLHPLLRPLFTTSFLIDDFLDEEKFFGAEQVLILSASSKTALGTAYCLKERAKESDKSAKVTGLTSSGNMAFTQNTGFYDEVQSYDAITDLNPDVKTVIVDMSGNAGVIATLQDHFEENLTYICRVGLSHWDAAPGASSKQATPQAFFFAPDRAQKRMADWGGSGFMQKLGARWIPFLGSAATWLEVEKAEGVGAILKAYKDVLGGTASPDKGYLFTV